MIDKQVLHPDQLTLIFQNLEQILDIHSRWSKKLQTIKSATDNVGRLLLEMVRTFIIVQLIQNETGRSNWGSLREAHVCLFPFSRPHTINIIVNIRRIDNIIDRVRSCIAIFTEWNIDGFPENFKPFHQCGLLILTSIKMDIVNIDIDNIIDRVRSAIKHSGN